MIPALIYDSFEKVHAMKEQEAGSTPNERRELPRLSVYSFLHATAVLSDPDSIEGSSDSKQKLYCTGLLADISHDGAQLALPVGCENYLKEQQEVKLHVSTTFVEEMKIDVDGLVIYVQPAKNHNGMVVGVQFTGLDKNRRAALQIKKIHEYGEKLKTADSAQTQQRAFTES
jgi:hypothetical protein